RVGSSILSLGTRNFKRLREIATFSALKSGHFAPNFGASATQFISPPEISPRRLAASPLHSG
ncbi:MAG: hypothetical protein IJU65_02680, partial [Desulfovibrio sp.]|nr:hypothetical protein [Desulfovibrio sp.]